MPDLAHWSVFLAATIVLLLIPGPTVMYVIGRGIDQGYRGALFSAIGLALGDMLQILFFGIAFVSLGFVTNSLYGCLGGKLGSFARQSPRFQTAARYLNAASMITLGVMAALTPAPRKATAN